ncbi:MAG: histidine kinase [Flavobacteriaceae bacterium]|nr:histidine kinase [Flavobacteriaceae bacterium]
MMIWGVTFSQQYTQITSKEGLPSEHVYRITQDHQGFIWFLTDRGLVKYNGNQFKTFTTKEGLPTNDIWDIRITPDNKVWYFSKASALGYIKNDTVYKFKNKDAILYPFSINQSHNKVSFVDAENYIFFKDNKWKEKKITSQFSKNTDYNTYFIEHDSILQLEINLKTKTLFVFDKNKKLRKKIREPKLSENIVYYGQINDSLFCWITKKNILLFNNNNFQLRNISLSERKQYTRYIYANNQIIFTAENFLAILNPNYTLKNIKTPNYIKSHASFIDKQENVWLATISGGVYFLSRNKKQVKIYFPNKKVGRMQIINNDLWVTVFEKGFVKYDEEKKTFLYSIQDHSFLYNIVAIDSLQTKYFISSETIHSVSKNKQIKYDNINNALTRDLVYFKGNLYGFISFGLNVLDSKTLKIKKHISQSGIRDIITYKKKLIIGTSNGIKEVKNDTIVPITKIKKPILKLIKHKDNLIVCTDGFGVYTSDINTTTLLEKSEFLSVQSAFAKGEELYLATNKGVWEYSLSSTGYKFKKKYTTQDGLHTNLCNDVVVKDKQLFVSSNSGISVLSKPHKNTTLFLDIYFDKVVYDTLTITNLKKVKYSSNSRLVTQIATIDYAENNYFNYKYKLSPVQKNWTSSTSPNIEFSNLTPNNYTLLIKKGDKQKKLHFTIEPLWWQTVYFKAGIFIFFALLVGVLSWLLSKKIQQSKNQKIIQEKQLAQIQLKALRSQLNPHFVFNSLAAIQYYINENDLETSDKYLVKFSKLIRRFFELSKEEEIHLSEEIKLLTNYLEIEKLRFRDKFTFTITIDPKINTKTTIIPTMLLQPIVENAVNHGIFNKLENGKITIEFLRLNEDKLKVIIIDDGVGYCKTHRDETDNLKSSGVLQDRIYFLNQANKWIIKHTISEAFVGNKNIGTKVTFTIITKK